MNRSLLNLLANCWLFCFVAMPLCAQQNTRIRYLGIEHGLSNNSVRCIYQDHSGFMWIGTYAGLNRFDGAEIKIFRNKPYDTASLVHNYIFSIYETDGKLWVGTGQGVVSMDRRMSRFSLAKFYRSADHVLGDLTMSTNLLTGDLHNNLFIGTNGWGLMVKKAGEPYASQVNARIGGKISDDYTVTGAVVVANRLYLGIPGAGIFTYDSKHQLVVPLNQTVPQVNCMAADQQGHIWVGTENGLYQYDIATATYTRHYTQADGALPLDAISSVQVHNGELWIGTDGAGIAILELKSGRFRYLHPGKGPGQLSSEAIYAIENDAEGRIWIGTHKGGCDIIDEASSRFNTVANDPFNSNSLVSNFVYSFYETQAGNIIIGTDGGGLSIWDRATNRYRNYSHQQGDPHSLSHNSVTSITADHEGAIWVSTLGGGINRLRPNTGSFDHFSCINDSTGAENKSVLNVFEDSRQNLWATSFGKLYRFNRQTNRFQVFSQSINDPISIFEDRSGILWTGNSNQLFPVNPVKGQPSHYDIGKPVRAIREDARGNFWLGTEGGGLVLFDRKQGKIVKRYTDADGLCSNAVLNILEDKRGNLWLSTFYGLSKFDPARQTFRNFYQNDGLQSNQFNYRAAYQLKSGEMLFGGIQGFNIFHPDSILPRTYMPQTFITDLSINSKSLADLPANYLEAGTDNNPLRLTVPYYDALLSVKFNAIEFASPEKIDYAYYLKGWDRNWVYSGNSKTINYNNLWEGNYTLYVKNTNAAGVWNKEKAVLYITVLPPWYRSWWAYTLYCLLFVGAIWLYLRYKKHQTRMEYEMKLTHLEAEKEKELNEKKLNFFTNISHEFRTPLTLIINPVKDLLYGSHEKAVDTSDLNIVYRNARRLLSLVDQLLLFRKADTAHDQLRVSNASFNDLCYEVFLCFTRQAASKHILYEFQPAAENTEVYMDTEKIEIALFNLLSNAIKYTPENGRVTLTVALETGAVSVAVTDSGPGISAGRRAQLFEKFYQAKEIQGQTGFGIGLYVARTFVEQHKGTITYQPNPDTGSCFRISLQQGRNHFDAGTVFQDSSNKSMILEELLEETETSPAQTAATTNEAASETAMSELVADERIMLVVDDHEQIRQYIAQLFNGQFKIYEANSAEAALPLARQFVPDIVISDVVMTGMTGIDLCNAIKTDPQLSHVPVILLTASSAADIKLKGIEYGADDYITKPFDKEILLARVNSLLQSRNNLQRYFYNEVTLQENHIRISAEHKEFLERCMEVVAANIDRDDFNIKMLAAEIGMSHSNLYKKIKSVSGQTANAFIRFIRLRKAAELMINSDHNVSEIAFQVGISDPRYFRDQFNQLFGMNPSEYIRKYRKPFQKKFNLNEKLTKPV